LLILFLGYCLLNAVRRVDFAGRDLTTWLQTLLHEKGHDFISGGKLKQLEMVAWDNKYKPGDVLKMILIWVLLSLCKQNCSLNNTIMMF